MRIWLIATSLFAITGCESIEELEIFSTAVERQPLNISNPEPLSLLPMEFLVVTDENFEEKMSKVEQETGSRSMIALSTKQYENLSLNWKSMVNYLKQMLEIHDQYRNYYE